MLFLLKKNDNGTPETIKQLMCIAILSGASFNCFKQIFNEVSVPDINVDSLRQDFDNLVFDLSQSFITGKLKSNFLGIHSFK